MQSNSSQPAVVTSPTSTTFILSTTKVSLPVVEPLKSLLRAENSEDEIVTPSLPQPPLENKSFDVFIKSQDIPKLTNHDFAMVEEVDGDELRLFYLKKNSSPPGALAACLPELEGTLAGFYRFLTPQKVAATHAVYNKQHNYIGVISEQIPNFTAVSVNPPRFEDLNVDFVREKNISFTKLDELDKEILSLENNHHKLKRQKKNLDRIENDTTAALAVSKINDPEQKDSTAELKEKFNANLIKKQVWIDAFNVSVMAIQNFYTRMENENNISKTEFDRFRKVKGLALGITVSYIFIEDDLHQFNISSEGDRYDFDMSLWSLMSHINDKGYIASTPRQPPEKSALVSKEDILNFPDVTVAQFSYWPTQETPLLLDEAREAIRKMLGLPKNSYPAHVIPVFKSLSKNFVFQHYKYVTMYKFILSNASMYNKIAHLHMCKDRQYKSRLLIEVITELLNGRIQTFQNVLLTLPCFAEFVAAHGETVFQEFKSEIENRNAHFQARASEMEADISNLKNLISQTPVGAETKSEELDENIKLLSRQISRVKLCKNQEINLDELNEARVDINNIIDIHVQKAKNKNPEEKADEQDLLKEQEEQYAKVKETVIKSMKGYTAPQISNALGFWRNHFKEAGQIESLCNDLDRVEYAKLSFLDKILKINTELQLQRNQLTSGGFFQELSALLNNQELWKLNQPIKMQSPSNLTF
jgi:hypothetical protein